MSTDEADYVPREYPHKPDGSYAKRPKKRKPKRELELCIGHVEQRRAWCATMDERHASQIRQRDTAYIKLAEHLELWKQAERAFEESTGGE